MKLILNIDMAGYEDVTTIGKFADRLLNTIDTDKSVKSGHIILGDDIIVTFYDGL